MVSAGVDVNTVAKSLEELVLSVVPVSGLLPSNGRVAEIHIQFRVTSANNFHLVYKQGTVGVEINLATDSGRLFADNALENYLEMRAPAGNQLSLKEFYLAATGPAQARIMAWYI